MARLSSQRRERGRAAVTLVVLGAVIGAAFLVWRQFEEKDRIIRELATRLERAWAQELLADIRVDSLQRPAAGPQVMRLTFIQYQRGTQEEAFRIPLELHGDEFYVDGQMIAFDRALVEAADPLRGKSLFLFRRAFGDADEPRKGVGLIGPATIPSDLRVDAAPSAFERDLWEQFWRVASDPVTAEKNGIAAAQGEAPHMRPVLGQVYQVTLRSSGGVQLKPRLPAAVLPGR